MKLELSRQILEKYSNIKFHDNLSIGNRPFPCGRKEGRTDGQRDKNVEAHSRLLLILRRHTRLLSYGM